MNHEAKRMRVLAGVDLHPLGFTRQGTKPSWCVVAVDAHHGETVNRRTSWNVQDVNHGIEVWICIVPIETWLVHRHHPYEVIEDMGYPALDDERAIWISAKLEHHISMQSRRAPSTVYEVTCHGSAIGSEHLPRA